MSDETAQVLAEIEAKRGYVLEFHRILAEADPAFLRAYDGLIAASYSGERSMSRREKELVYVAALTALGAERSHIAAHMEAGKRAGLTRQEMLEVVEMCLPPAGVPRFMNAIEAWREVYPAG